MSQRNFDDLFSRLLGEDARGADGPVEMVLAEKDLVVRAMPDATRSWIVTDLFVRDLLGFRAESLPLLHRALLVVNDVAARAGDFSVGIDGRAMLILTGRLRADGLTPDRYAGAFARWLEQVDLLRDTVAAIGMEHFALTYSMPDDGHAEGAHA